MARECVVVIKCCFLFCLFINNIYASIDRGFSDIELYDINPTYLDNFDDTFIDIKRVRKRDVTNTKDENPIDTNRSDRVLNPTATTKFENKTITKTKITILSDTPNKLLGVNGTGQRLHYDETEKPTHVLETIHKATDNITTNSNVSLNNSIAPNINITKTNQTSENNDNDDEISIDKFTLKEEEQILDKEIIEKNYTKKYEEDHLYYSSTFMVDPVAANKHWVDMDNHSDVKVNELLSQSHRRAATVKLSFDFPFYGHPIRNITIATGGFLYTGEYVHSWLAATQYIAPLMANFDTSLSNDSFVKYVDRGDSFTVLWEKVSLRDKPNDGEFTFEATLHKNGDIVFVYKDVPVIIEDIKDDHHPVKVGLSDAYIIDRTIFFVRRKTIYEYHRVQFVRQDIKNWTVIYLRATQTCLEMKDCASCLTQVKHFTCKWCETMKKCSNGIFRKRQDWMFNGCEQHQISNASRCSAAEKSEYFNNTNKMNQNEDSSIMDAKKSASIQHQDNLHRSQSNDENMGLSSVIGVMFLLGLVCVLVGWVLYAYRNPHTSSGQFLIRYRPSQWSWRRGEARYTAATIHM
ncbi:plexin domain-containing protein 2 isoform X2 [Chrysoperla carnea]|uniref:plexin domain-containing protein 2 isoform X2 n=1 Tax=Chrysoperla carnea TaxID=189513 RepID=UPI001D094A5A|nr:plexin domain-containing protein 2 isoform X2 [Chrysoperla carnea]